MINVTQRTLRPLGNAASQLQNNIAYKQASMEGKRRIRENVMAGRPYNVYDVALYDKRVEEMKQKLKPEKLGYDTTFLGKARSNFEKQ